MKFGIALEFIKYYDRQFDDFYILKRKTQMSCIMGPKTIQNIRT